MVKSCPGCKISAEESGRVYEETGTCSVAARYRTLGSKNMTGLGSRMEASSKPLACIGLLGTTI